MSDFQNHNYAPVFRVHFEDERDGLDLFYSFYGLAISDVSAPAPVSNIVAYEVEKVRRETVNRTIIEKPLGFRPTVALEFEFPDVSAERALVGLVSALVTDRARVFFSNLIGASVEREVMMDGAYRREPLGGKSLAGVRASLRVRCLDLIPEVPPALDSNGATQW